jgi:hypothetical protein
VWLHQHIFKVGWLLTKQYQTTTILYYAFFLPGILINQLIFWLMAGFLNVRAERSLAWPEKQEIGELKLDFVQLNRDVDPIRLAVISTTPLIAGMIIVWQIATNVLPLPAFWQSISQATQWPELLNAVETLLRAPDIWLWIYLAFTISNTMMPNLRHLRGWRYILIAIAVLGGLLYVLGIGNQVITSNLREPMTNALNALASIFVVIIGLDLFAVAVLGLIEAVIERITGHSATFRDGKMITMLRSEMLAQRKLALQRPQKPLTKAPALPSGPPTVYRLQFPIPGPPGKEAVSRESDLILDSGPKPQLTSPLTPVRDVPTLIPGTAEKPATITSPGSTSTALLSPSGLPKPLSNTTAEDQEDEKNEKADSQIEDSV